MTIAGRPKVFGIGLSKTGTTSLAGALTLLGYRTVHYPPLDRLPELLADVDAATDTPVACRFRELDERYPGARFILTVRDRPGWLASARREFAGRPVTEAWKREVRTRLYGVPDWQPASFLSGYDRHTAAVREHFAHRPKDLLVLDIFAGDPWPALCGFLRCPVPAVAFPHENAGFVGATGVTPA